MKTEKKIIRKNFHDYTIVKGKRWYVEYYIQLPAGVRQRKKVYGWINREKSDLDKWIKALEVIEKIEKERLFSTPMDRGNRGYELPDSPLKKVLERNRAFYRRKTYLTIKSRLKAYTLWLNGRSELKITTQDVNDFLNYYLEKGLKTGTVASYKNTLSGLYNKLDIQYNPFRGAMKITKGYTSLQYFNDQQIEMIGNYAAKADPEIWLACRLLFYCFIRPGEQRKLLVSDINIPEGFIEIRAEISKNKKTQKVRIPNVFIEPLSRWTEDKSGLLFSKYGEGKKMIGLNHINKKHREILKTLGIKGRYAFYSWKHTGAVKALRAGINVKDLQLQLRHHSLDMVNEYLKNLGVMDSEDLKIKFPAI